MTNYRNPAVDRVARILDRPAAMKYVGQFVSEPVTLGMVYSMVLETVDEMPEIAECEPASIVRAVGRAASWDLRISSRGPAYLLAQPNERGRPKLAAMQSYIGKVTILQRTNMAPFVEADIVCEGELIEYEKGTTPDIRHLPDTFKPGGRSKTIVGAYAWTVVPGVKLERGAPVKRIAALNAVEIVDHINQWSARLKGKALETMPQYAVARAVYKLAKMLPAPSENVRLLVADDIDDDAWKLELDLSIEAQSPAEDQMLGRVREAPTATGFVRNRPRTVEAL